MAGTGAVHDASQKTTAEPPGSHSNSDTPTHETLDGEAVEQLTTALDQALDHHSGPLDPAAALTRELKRLGLEQHCR